MQHQDVPCEVSLLQKSVILFEKSDFHSTYSFRTKYSIKKVRPIIR